MTAQAYRVNDASIVAELFDNEAIIMNLADGVYFTLSGTAAEIWSMVEAGYDAPAMAARLCDRHGVDAETCQSDLSRLFAELVAQEIVLETAPGTAGPVEDVDFGPYKTPELTMHTDMAEVMAMDPPLPELKPAGKPSD